MTKHKIIDFYTLNYYVWYEYYCLIYSNIKRGSYDLDILLSSNTMLFNYDFHLI